MGFLDAILNQGDQTPDSTGMTPNDKAQTGFHGLTNLGAILMAGGQPMWGNERAKYLAALGQVPKGMQEEQQGIVQQRRGAQQLISEKQKQDQLKSIQAMADDPELVKGMPPAMQALVKMAARSGQLAPIMQAQKDMQPVMSAGNLYDKARGTLTNGVTGMTTQVHAPLDGSPPTAQAVGGGNQPPAEMPAGTDPVSGVHPDTGIDEKYMASLATQRPQGYTDQLRRIAMGDQEYPKSVRQNPMKPYLDMDIGKVFGPGQRPFSDIDHTAKQKFNVSVTSGPLFQKTVAPMQKGINHFATMLGAVDDAGLVDNTGIDEKNPDGTVMGGIDAATKNAATMLGHKAKGDGKASALNMAKDNAMTEFTKMMRGTGGTTDQAQTEAKIKTIGEALGGASTPKEYQAVAQMAKKFMLGQLEPVVSQYQQNMRRPSAGPMDLLGPQPKNNDPEAHNVRNSMNTIDTWQPKSRKAPVAEAGAAPAAPAGIDPAALAEAKRRGLIK